MSVSGIHHISLKVPIDLYDSEVNFYRNLLGLKVVRMQDTAVFLSGGNVIIEILNSGEGYPSRGALDHFAFQTDDVDGLLDTLRRAGYRVTMEPTEHVFTGERPYCVYIAFVEGPAGESIELFKEF